MPNLGHHNSLQSLRVKIEENGFSKRVKKMSFNRSVHDVGQSGVHLATIYIKTAPMPWLKQSGS